METKKMMFFMEATMNAYCGVSSLQKLIIDELSNGNTTKREELNKKFEKAFDIQNKEMLEILIPLLPNNSQELNIYLDKLDVLNKKILG